ncbi:MAG: electron transport complex subunit RsxC [Clostridiales bacterium]|nr:electron transport complex subunit RsxC [Clostridiales bacterium]
MRSFRGGVHPKTNKNTDVLPSIRLTDFPEVDVSLHQQIGPPCTSIVAPGDYVYVGQVIARSDHPMGVPIHSGVSGTVKELHHVVSPVGEPIDAIRIESDGKFTDDPSIAPPVINSREDFLAAVRESGLVGLGGASFPTHIKLNPPRGKEPNVLLINAAECEPYITSDYRMICENPDQIIDGILAVMKWIDIPTTIIGYEDNKPLVSRIFDHELGKRVFKTGEKHDIRVRKMKTIYPQGAEKMFIYALTGRKVPPGKLPHDVGVLVLNVSTARHIGKYIKTGMPLVRRRITLDGSALNIHGNFNVPIGAHVGDVITAAGGLREEPQKVIMGGPMMGIALDRIDSGIVKANNAILVFGSKETRVPPDSACIRCGRCVMACPMALQPAGIDQAARRNDAEMLQRFHVMDCIECGSCTYVCPAKRFLNQSITNGKKLIRAEKERYAHEQRLLAASQKVSSGKEEQGKKSSDQG